MEAEAAYAIANAPMFLVRKLGADSAASQIESEFSAEDILKAIEDAVKRKPKSVRDAVLPYVLAVALSKKSDASFLHKATKIKAPSHEWFDYVVHVLEKTYQSTSSLIVKVPAGWSDATNQNSDQSTTNSRLVFKSGHKT